MISPGSPGNRELFRSGRPNPTRRPPDTFLAHLRAHNRYIDPPRGEDDVADMSRTLREGDAAEAGLDARRLDQIRERAASWVADGLTPALVLVAARRGVVALHEAFGKLTPEPDSPSLATDSVFPVSSLCKPITASALLMLVEDGLVAMNAPVTDYIPELDGPGMENILVHHLLTHTSGLADPSVVAFQNERLRERLDLPPLPATQHKRVHLLLTARNGCPPDGPPDETMAYCTHGYDLLGEIVRRQSGQAFEDFMRERVFEPLGMRDSSYRLEPQFRVRLVKRSALDNPYGADMNDEGYLDMPLGGSGLKSVALDVARFAQALLNGGRYGERRLLSRASVHEMTHNQIPDGVDEMGIWDRGIPASYGYGCFVTGRHRWPMNGRLVPEGAFGHGGMGGANFWADPLNEVVGVMFSVWVFPEGSASPARAPKLTAARFQDMLTAAVVD